jgi:hypothetical protein
MTNLTHFNVIAIINLRPDDLNVNPIESVTHMIHSLAKEWNKFG